MRGQVEDSTSLPICQVLPKLGKTLATCGLGTSSQTSFDKPRCLREAYFYESVFENPVSDDYETCLPSNICTEPLREGSSICTMDTGNPLFTTTCGLKMIPKCLYGVASYFHSSLDTPGKICNGGSVFTNVFELNYWIQGSMKNNSHVSIK